MKVNMSLANKIKQLDEALKAEFGCDYAYTIMGRGEVVGARNAHHGHVNPSIKDEDCLEPGTMAQAYRNMLENY